MEAITLTDPEKENVTVFLGEWISCRFQRSFSALSYFRHKAVQFSLVEVLFAWLHRVFKFFETGP